MVANFNPERLHNMVAINEEKRKTKREQLTDMTRKPDTLAVVEHQIPPKLKSYRWCVWRWTPNAKGDRWAKIPLQPGGNYKAMTNKPSTFKSYTQALTDYNRRSASGRIDQLDGIGVLITDDLCGIDLDDDCPDREDVAKDIGSYAEFSPTGGTGLKVFCVGKCPGKQRQGNHCEIYDRHSARWFAVTGHRFGDRADVTECQPDIDRFYALKIATAEAESKAKMDHTKPIERAQPNLAALAVEDAELIDIILSDDRYAQRFEDLYAGEWVDRYDSQSDADAAMVALLGRYCDAEGIDRIFRTSALYRDKWDRESYREMTIEKFGTPKPRYDWNGYRLAAEGDKLVFDGPIVGKTIDLDAVISGKTKVTETITWEELKVFASKQVDKWIVRDILEPGTSTILAGPPYAGKTTILSQLMACIATERPYLGYEIVQRCPLLFLNCDRLRERHIVKRISRVFADPLDESKLSDLFFTVNLPSLPITITPTYLLDVMAIVENKLHAMGSDTGLTILDPLRGAFLREAESGAENDPTQMAKIMTPIRQIAQASNWAIITPHHTAKASGKYAGATSIVGCSDGVWTLDRDETSTTAHLQITDRDGTKPRISFEERLDGLHRLDTPAIVRKAQDAQGAFLAAMPSTEKDGLTLAGMIDKGIATRSTLQRLIQDAGDAIAITGTGAKGDPKRYYRK